MLESAIERVVPHRKEVFTGIAQFSKIAPFLSNPLVLFGLVAFLFSGTLAALLKAGKFAKLSQTHSLEIFRKILNYGLVIALAVIVFGSIYAFRHGSSLKTFAPQGNNDQNIDTNNGTAVQENK